MIHVGSNKTVPKRQHWHDIQLESLSLTVPALAEQVLPGETVRYRDL